MNELAYYTERLQEGAMDWKLTDGEIKSEVVALADYPNEQELEAYHRVARAAARKVVVEIMANSPYILPGLDYFHADTTSKTPYGKLPEKTYYLLPMEYVEALRQGVGL